MNFPARLFALAILAGLGLPALAGTIIDLSVDGSRSAPNDLARATAFAEASGTSPGELAAKVNGQVAEGLRLAKAAPGIKVQSGGTSTYPIYGKGGKIESWRMRSDIVLEASDSAALSELLGKLQANLGISSLRLMPAPETRKKAENEAIVDAINAFKARARLTADTLGKAYRIKQMNIGTSGRPPAVPMMRAAALSAEAAPMPMEAGESNIVVTISGQIELAD